MSLKLNAKPSLSITRSVYWSVSINSVWQCMMILSTNPLQNDNYFPRMTGYYSPSVIIFFPYTLAVAVAVPLDKFPIMVVIISRNKFAANTVTAGFISFVTTNGRALVAYSPHFQKLICHLELNETARNGIITNRFCDKFLVAEAHFPRNKFN